MITKNNPSYTERCSIALSDAIRFAKDHNNEIPEDRMLSFFSGIAVDEEDLRQVTYVLHANGIHLAEESYRLSREERAPQGISFPSPVSAAAAAEKKEEPQSVEEKEEPELSGKNPSDEKSSEKKLQEKNPAEEKAPVNESAEEEKEEKRSLTDVEFWTLLLTPEFDTRAWWAVRHALSALFKLFRMRFADCFVEGIRFQEYENMGYAAALNGVLKSFPYIGAWDFRMDWTRDHEPHAEGHLRASINVCRVLGLILAILFYGGIVAFTFWRRRAKILKTGELPELGFIRSKIVKMMSEDD